MVPCTRLKPIVSIRCPAPLFIPEADHDVNLAGMLKYSEKQYGLVTGLRQLTDLRRSNKTYPFASMAALLFAMVVTQSPSLHNFMGPGFGQGSNSSTLSLSNCCMKIISGRSGDVKCVPSRSALDNVIGKLRPEEIRALMHQMIEMARDNGIIKEHLIDGYGILALDGSEIFRSARKSCDTHCQIVDHHNGVREYVHRFVLGSLVLDSTNIAVDYELLHGADAVSKGEAEIKGAAQMLPRCFERFPGLINLVTADALYPTAAMVNLSRKFGVPFAIRIKDMRRKAVKEARTLFDTGGGSSKTFVGELRNGERMCVIAHWTECAMSGVEDPVRIVRFIQIPLGPDGKMDLTADPETGELVNAEEAWMLVTSEDVPIEVVWKAMRLRWTIENTCFHQLKKYYHLGHLYHHEGCEAMLALTLLAFNTRELFQLRYTLYNACGQLCTKMKLTEKLRDDLKRQRIFRLFNTDTKHRSSG